MKCYSTLNNLLLHYFPEKLKFSKLQIAETYKNHTDSVSESGWDNYIWCIIQTLLGYSTHSALLPLDIEDFFFLNKLKFH